MTVEEMQYDFKIKFNKLDSNDYRDFQVPEIDWLLNEAQEVFLKQRYGINNTTQKGFEGSQKRIDDLRNLVMKNISLSPVTQVISDPVSYEGTLPPDYIFAIRVQAVVNKHTCGDKTLVCKPIQHDDLSNCLLDPNYNPSYEWGEMPIVYGTLSANAADANRIFGYTDGSFTVTSFILDYLREPKRIAFPGGVPGNVYNLPNGLPVNLPNQNCELPEHTHREIVDIATLIAAGDINHPGYQVKAAKTSMHE
tara:strand:- start:2150 stop:2902 length:753 start_codon:yes stop_codon:yes gene_type:complete